MFEYNKYFKALLFLIPVLFLLTPALFLGYPILHGDSGSYIYSGFRHIAPVERPITYGLFVWLTSLGLSLWFVVISQAVITTFVIHIFLKRLLNETYSIRLLIIIVFVLTLTSSTAYFVSQIKPDIFLPLILLALFSFLIGTGKPGIQDIFLGVIVMLGLLSHLSHLPLVTGLIITTFALSLMVRKLRVNLFVRKFLLISFLVLSAWLIAPSVNYILTGSFRLSRVPNIFSVSRLLQAGIFQDYVREKCKVDSSFQYCKYEGELGNYSTYYDFLWDKESFLYDDDCIAKGKLNCWEERDEEFGVLVKEIYSQKKYRNMLARNALQTSAMQFISFDIPSFASFEHHPYPMEKARIHLPADNSFLENARQSKQDLQFPVQNVIQLAAVIASLVIIVYFMIWKGERIYDSRMELLGIMIMILLAGNAAFIGIFAGPAERFQSRLIWLVPLYAMILIFQSGCLSDRMWGKCK